MNAPVNEKVQARLRKLLALAQRGEGGEKANAQRMLEKMLERHGLSIEDLNDERRQTRWFPITNTYERKLAAQIMGKVCNTWEPGVYTSKARPKQVGVDVTAAEAIEFELHYDALRKALAEHFADAYSAFVAANCIYPTVESQDASEPPTERDFRVMAMAGAIPRTRIHQRLPGNSKGAKP